MYDMAKRSLAFTVATGGLLLSGPGFAPLAEAAVTGVGNSTGPEQAQEASGAHTADSSALSVPLSLREASPAHAPGLRDAASPGGASAQGIVSGSGGILSGNSVQVPVDLGLDLCGTNVVALAVQDVVGKTTCTSSSGSSAGSITDHSGGILSGNAVQVPVSAPILACGTSVSVAAAQDASGPTLCDAAPAAGSAGGSSATAISSHSGGVLSGNIVQAPVNLPVDACGTSVTAVGADSSTAGANCSSAGSVGGPASAGASATAFSANSGGIGSGLIVQAPVNAPVTACDNHVGVVESGDRSGAGTSCLQGDGGATASAGSVNSGGIVAGDTVQAPVNTPVDVCGNTVEAVGDHDTAFGGPAECATLPGQGGAHSISITSHSGGIGSGDTVATPITVPVQACGDNVTAVTVHAHEAGADCSAGTTATSVISTGNSGGIGSGTGVGAPVGVPVLLCGIDAPVGSVDGVAGAAACGDQPPVVNQAPPAPPAGPPVAPPPAPPAPPAAPPAPLAPPAPAQTHVRATSLAETGGGEATGLALAGSALLIGLGLRATGRHRMQ